MAKHYGWGWKEPNSHIFLNHLATCFPDLHYIHVLRHGLDMAYSSNQQQLLNWGKLYGVTVIDKNRVSPPELLHYWIAANNHAIKTGKMLLQDRFLVIRLEDLCTQPRSSIKTMADFLGLGLDTDRLAKLESLPIMPKSSGR